MLRSEHETAVTQKPNTPPELDGHQLMDQIARLRALGQRITNLQVVPPARYRILGVQVDVRKHPQSSDLVAVEASDQPKSVTQST